MEYQWRNVKLTAEEKISVFRPLLEKFETDHVKAWCAEMIGKIDDKIFEIAASTSSKHHNKTQCQPHGQVYHIIMFATIMNYILDLEYVQKKFKSPEQRDAMRCTPYLHDALKLGLGNSSYTVHEHPILAAEWIKNVETIHPIDDKVKKAIADMVAAHSGQWTTSKKSKIELPMPQNDMQFVVHLCDYLSSRSDIDMRPPDYLKDIFEDMNEPLVFDENYVLPFGRYAQQRLIDVYRADPGYCEWMEANIQKREVVNNIKAMKEYLKNKENINES